MRTYTHTHKIYDKYLPENLLSLVGCPTLRIPHTRGLCNCGELRVGEQTKNNEISVRQPLHCNKSDVMLHGRRDLCASIRNLVFIMMA